ncbi:MG2 domain-containing protein [Verrucomicrobium sp. BvORR106]|uniref:MG2 domain-containing protein n=1 Tax=Verrucomicrobium sp. BvORR106 TaxID=1403819 RepID=UPI00056E3899|nr:MG2 domain-containing protein [Verrucomicrobium sp. BvORR106]
MSSNGRRASLPIGTCRWLGLLLMGLASLGAVEPSGPDPSQAKQFEKLQEIIRKIELPLREAEKPAALLDAYEAQPYGEFAKVGLCYRNAGEISFTARRVDMLNLTSLVRYKATLPPATEHNRTGVSQTSHPLTAILQRRAGWRTWLTNMEGELLLDLPRNAVRWQTSLPPGLPYEGRRMEVITPLKEPGVYFLKGRLANGAVTQCIVDISGLVLLAKMSADPAGGYGYGYVLDARTGHPVPDAKVRWAGIRKLDAEEARATAKSYRQVEFPLPVGADGSFPLELTHLQDSSLMLEAWTPDGRMTLGGHWMLDRLCRPEVPEPISRRDYFLASDRSCYRPGDQVQVAVWSRSPSESGKEVEVKLYNARSQPIARAVTTMNEHGMSHLTLDVPQGLAVGEYHLSSADCFASVPLMIAQGRTADEIPRIKIHAPTQVVGPEVAFPLTFQLEDPHQERGIDTVIECQVDMLPSEVIADNTGWDWLYGKNHLTNRVQHFSDLGWPWPSYEHPTIVARRQLTTDAEGKAAFDFALASWYQARAELGQKDYRVTAYAVRQGQVVTMATVVIKGPLFVSREITVEEGIRVTMDKPHYRAGEVAQLKIETLPGGPLLLYDRIERGRYARAKLLEVDAGGRTTCLVSVRQENVPERMVEIVGVRRSRCFTSLVRIPVLPERELAIVDLGIARSPAGERAVTLKAVRADGQPLPSARVVMSAYLADLEPSPPSPPAHDFRRFLVSALPVDYRPWTPNSIGEINVDPEPWGYDRVLSPLQTKANYRKHTTACGAHEPHRMPEEFVQKLLAQSIPWPDRGQDAGQYLWETSLTTSEEGVLQVPLRVPANLPDEKVRVRAWVRGNSGEFGQAMIE